MLCLFGVCIPYSMIWPLILIAIREIWNFFMPTTKDQSKLTKSSTIDEKNTIDSGKEDPKLEIINKRLKDEVDWKYLVDIASKKRPLFARFTATWCKPCKAVEPAYIAMSEKFETKASFVTVDVDEFDDISAEWKAAPIPVVICIKDGSEVARVIGADADKIEAFLLEHST